MNISFPNGWAGGHFFSSGGRKDYYSNNGYWMVLIPFQMLLTM